MSKILCLHCYEIYEKERINFDNYLEFNFCPNVNCDGAIIEVDEMILPTIKLLNQKGYMTEYCCSGHYGRDISSIYIKFYEECFEDIINSDLPEEFEIESGSTIRYSPNEELGSYAKFTYIMMKNIELLRWAMELADFDY